jgi:hypothetical protein
VLSIGRSPDSGSFDSSLSPGVGPPWFFFSPKAGIVRRDDRKSFAIAMTLSTPKRLPKASDDSFFHSLVLCDKPHGTHPVKEKETS